MSISKEQLEALRVSALPLISWLKMNVHPHTMAIVDNERVELMEGLAMIRGDAGEAAPAPKKEVQP